MAEIGETNTQDQHQASSPWYFAHHGKRYGPGTLAQMKKLIAKGHIQSHTKYGIKRASGVLLVAFLS